MHDSLLARLLVSRRERKRGNSLFEFPLFCTAGAAAAAAFSQLIFFLCVADSNYYTKGNLYAALCKYMLTTAKLGVLLAKKIVESSLSLFEACNISQRCTLHYFHSVTDFIFALRLVRWQLFAVYLGAYNIFL